MKRSSLALCLVFFATVLSGCSDYPSSGVIDTREVRQLTNIEDVSGAVFGLKEGAKDNFQLFGNDKFAMLGLKDLVWAHVAEGAEKPVLILEYPGVDKSAILASTDSVIELFKVQYDDALAKNQKEINAMNADKAFYVSKYDELKAAQGNSNQVAWEIDQITRKMSRVDEKIDRISSKEHIRKDVFRAINSVNSGEEFSQSRDAYTDAVLEAFWSDYIVKLSDIEKATVDGNVEGAFDGIGSGYDAIVSVTDLLVNDGRRKKVLRSLGAVELISDDVKNSDVLKISIDRRGVSRRGDDDSQEKMKEDVLEFLQ
jgi:hypothetical protein